MRSMVFVVDDDAGVQNTLTANLEEEGYDVVVAADGVEALEKLEGRTPSLILLDLMMPRMDGYTFAEELRRLGLRERYPIVVLTADGRARQKAERVGAEGYLEKPFSVTALLEEVARLAGGPN